MPHLVAIALLALAGTYQSSLTTEDQAAKETVRLSRQLSFVENRGQWAPEAKFLARSQGMNLWVTSSGIVYDFYKLSHRPEDELPHRRKPGVTPNREVLGHVVKVEFEGASPHSEAVGRERQSGYVNYIRGEASESSTLIPKYASARVHGIYPGVDLVSYQDPTTAGARYDLVLEPGADLSQIRMRYTGAERLRVLPNGQVAFDTVLGTITERGLKAYEVDAAGLKIPVEVKANIVRNALTYSVPKRDPKKKLIIDPLIYSTFLGGSNADYVMGMAVGTHGSAYVTGYTYSTDFPTTSGAYKKTSPGNTDAFVTKVNPDGRNVGYSTYLGGQYYDAAYAITVDATGAVYVLGETGSDDFPTKNPYQATIKGGQDIFVSKLNNTGSGLTYSTYIGGSNYDYGRTIAIDDGGRAYLAGITYSTDFPTVNPIQPANGGNSDALIAKLSAGGGNLIYSTYLGGSNYDESTGIAVDGLYRPIVVGFTYSTDFPTANPLQGATGGGQDVFITKYASNGANYVFSTYLGGDSSDAAYDVATDANNAIFVAGIAYSSSFPSTKTFGSANYGGFLTKLPSNGASIAYSDRLSYLYLTDVVIDINGRPIVGGYSYGGTLSTPGAYQPSNATGGDAYVAHLTLNGQNLLYATHLGGWSGDYVTDIGCDMDGNAYVAGYTYSPDFPIQANGYDTVYPIDDPQQSFVSKISLAPQRLSVVPVWPPVGGQLFSLTVAIHPAAPAGGKTVALSGGGGILELPASIVIPEGQSSVTVQANSKGVDSLRIVSIIAKLGTTTASRRVMVHPAVPTRVAINPVSVVGGSSTDVVGRVILNGKAGPSGLVVKLSTRHLPSWAPAASVPSTVTVPPGADRVSFPVTHKATAVDSRMYVTATALDVSASGTLLITKP